MDKRFQYDAGRGVTPVVRAFVPCWIFNRLDLDWSQRRTVASWSTYGCNGSLHVLAIRFRGDLWESMWALAFAIA